jgi:SMC interacting uncharacterized protein involved in chromosome segregation
MSRERIALEEAEEMLRESIRLFKEISKMANTIRVITHSAAEGNDIGTAFAALDVAEKYAEDIDGALDELRCDIDIARSRINNGLKEPEAVPDEGYAD